MVKRLLDFLGRETNGLHRAAYLLGFFTLLGQILALVRDRLFASHFGAGAVLDIYYASFRIPDFIFVTVSSLISVTILIPILTRMDDKKAEERFISSVYTVFFFIMLVVIAVMYVAMPALTRLVTPGISSPLLVDMSRILLLSPFILGISNLCGGIIQTRRRFLAYALSPVFYNVGIIVGLLYLYPLFGLMGLVYGVILGSFLHLLIQLPTLQSLDLVPTMTMRINWKDIRQVFFVSLPRTFTLASGNIMNLALIAIGSLMAVGSISVFTFAMNMQSVPLSIIGVSYSLAAFPTLSQLWSKGERGKFFLELSAAVKHVLFWSIPIIVLFIVLRAQTVRTIYGAGMFDWNATRLTAAALALFAISLVAQNIILLCVRAHYAMGNTRKPLMYAIIGALSSLVAVVVGLFVYTQKGIVYGFFESLLKVSGLSGTEVLVLPLAFSVGSTIQAILLWHSLSFDEFRKAFNIGRSVFQSLGASILMGYAAYLMLNVLDNVLNIDTLRGIFAQGLGAGVVGILVGACVLVGLDNPEIKVIWKTLRSRIWKTKPLAESPQELI